MSIRYAVVGAGWISQIAFMPGVDLTGNAKMTAHTGTNQSLNLKSRPTQPAADMVRTIEPTTRRLIL